jgi:hypothetical protein
MTDSIIRTFLSLFLFLRYTCVHMGIMNAFDVVVFPMQPDWTQFYG